MVVSTYDCNYSGGRLRQEGHKFRVSLNDLVKPCFKIKKKKKPKELGLQLSVRTCLRCMYHVLGSILSIADKNFH